MKFVALENYWKSMAVHRISTNKQNGDIASLNIGQNAISSISVANFILNVFVSIRFLKNSI